MFTRLGEAVTAHRGVPSQRAVDRALDLGERSGKVAQCVVSRRLFDAPDYCGAWLNEMHLLQYANDRVSRRVTYVFDGTAF